MPQLLYWFAMPFTTPVPWEAVAYYDGKERPRALRRSSRRHRPLSAGASTRSSTASCWSATRPGTAAAQPACRTRPARCFPTRDRPDDIDRRQHRSPPMPAGACRSSTASTFVREREDIPRFNKFLQGYYDDGGIIKESFDAVVQNDRLSPAMPARGMRLDKDGGAQHLLYRLQHGRSGASGRPAGERGRKLRQAMSLVIDYQRSISSCSSTARGVPAQSPLPPGIFGYDRQLPESASASPISAARRKAARRGRLSQRHRPRHRHAR